VCGIGGYICKKPFDDVDKESIIEFTETIEAHGKDAFGWFNGFKVFKAPINASAFWSIIRELGDLDKVFPRGCRLFLFHCREATHGSPKKNENNHPFEGKNFIIAHNGIISNYREFFDPQKEGVETDSYAILKVLEDNYDGDAEKALRSLEKLEGSMSIWIYCKPERRLFIYTNQNNVVYESFDDVLMFYTGREGKDVKAFKDCVVYEIDLDTLEVRELFKVEAKRRVTIIHYMHRGFKDYWFDDYWDYYWSPHNHSKDIEDYPPDFIDMVFSFLDIHGFGFEIHGDLVKITRVPKEFRGRIRRNSYYTWEELYELLYPEISEYFDL